MFTFAPATPGTALTAFSTHERHFAGDRTSRRGQRHVDTDKMAIVDIDVVDQSELIDVRRNFRVINSLQSGDDGLRSTCSALQATSARAP